jgi:nucleotide-binding universal stress UspA family protein
MYKHILIPTDGSDLSNKAIRQGGGRNFFVVT